MKLSEILKQETTANTCVYLYREGLFWKAYEYSAYTFVRSFRPYRAQKKWIKGIKQEVVSIGFPDSKLAEIIDGHEKEEISEKMIGIKGTPLVDEAAFQEWKSGMPSQDNPQSAPAGPAGEASAKAPVDKDGLLARLTAFRVECSTPVQCMIFITELQKDLRS